MFEDRRVLLVKRGRASLCRVMEPSWGARSEGDETPRETACRELKEETGIEAEIEGIVDTVRVAAR